LGTAAVTPDLTGIDGVIASRDRPWVAPGSWAGSVELVHQLPVGLAGGCEFLLAFLQRFLEVVDGLPVALKRYG